MVLVTIQPVYHKFRLRLFLKRKSSCHKQKRSACGIVVYSGLNNDGDFFIGNKKINSATGKESTFDIPIATITGQDPSRLSVVFDEVIVKERLLVEGGKSKTILSEFDGPVNFGGQVKVNGGLTVNGTFKLNNTFNILILLSQ